MPVRSRSDRIRRAKTKRSHKQTVVQKRGKEELREDRTRRLSTRDIFEDEWDWL